MYILHSAFYKVKCRSIGHGPHLPSRTRNSLYLYRMFHCATLRSRDELLSFLQTLAKIEKHTESNHHEALLVKECGVAESMHKEMSNESVMLLVDNDYQRRVWEREVRIRHT